MEIRRLHRDTITSSEAGELAHLRSLIDPRRLASDPPVTAELAVDELRASVGTFAFEYCGAFEGERLLGFGESFGRVDAENADVSDLGIWVDPDHLGRGLHQQIFDHLDAIERARGRTRYWGWGDLHDSTTRRFWETDMGYELAYDERVSRCDVQRVDPALMQHWIDRAPERAGRYHLERAMSPFDDRMLGYFAQGLEAMNDAPHDSLEFEHESYDIDHARQVEQVQVETRSEYRLIAAIETDTAALAGYTAVRVPRAEPTRAQQGDTVTVEQHRNQGIGRWLKAEMWTWLRTTRPEVEFLETGNAESNRAMLDINEAMGFVDVRHEGVWQLANQQ